MKLYILEGFLIVFFLVCAEKQQWTIFNTKNTALTSDFIRQILVKNNSLQWVGTFGGGLFKVENNSFTKIPLPNGGDYILSLIPDSIGGLWIGTAQNGAYYYNNGSWKHLSKVSGLTDNNVWHILIDSKLNTWFCSRYKGVCKLFSDSLSCLSVKNGLPDQQVTLAVEDNTGRIWFGTARGGLCGYKDDQCEYINSTHGLKGNYIRALICDSIPRWVGTWDGGLNYFNDSSWALISDIKKPVVFVDYDKKGNLWVGTWGHGVYIRQSNDNMWRNITKKTSGLPNDYVIDIKFDSKGAVYCATSKGVARYTGY